MAKVSVEYAHIYTNQHIGEEHEISLDVLGEVKSQSQESGEEISLVVLIDDYSFPDPSFNYDSFTEWLSDKGFAPDLVFRESQLIPVCDQVLSLIDKPKLKQQITDYVKAKKYPCSLFIAAWYLLRLGKLQSAMFGSELVGDKLINILPESFKPFEDEALKIIAATPFAEVLKGIEYRYIEGRLIA